MLTYVKLGVILISLSFLSCKKETKETKKNVKKVVIDKSKKVVTKEVVTNDFRFVTANKGLLYREIPEGKVLGKFVYASKVEVLETTTKEKIVLEGKNKIKGHWVKVKVNDLTAYAFDGYLSLTPVIYEFSHRDLIGKRFLGMMKIKTMFLTIITRQEVI